MDTRIEFLYLSEEDTIKAGVNDFGKCVDVMEEVFVLLAKGDYLMGGPNHNSHGMGIIFPKQSPFPNMPLAGPDRRFFAMPAYLGGRFDVVGNKWYGSNAANKEIGQPRSILTVMLNDKNSGAPLVLMSANLLSAARTGGVPGVAARHLARKGSEVLAVIGCGPINRACMDHIISQSPSLKKVVCYDIFKEVSEKLAAYTNQNYPTLETVVSEDLIETVRDADITTVAASRLKPLYVEKAWFKKGASVFISGPCNGDEAFFTESTIVYDHIQLHQTYVSEAIESGDKEGYYSGVIGGPIYRLIDAGKLPALESPESKSIGQIINGEKPGRQSDDELILFVACGMAVYDVGFGYDLYQTALKQGIGQKLLLWDTPALNA